MGVNYHLLRSIAVNVSMFGGAFLALLHSQCIPEKYYRELDERHNYRDELTKQDKYVEYFRTYKLSPEALKAFEDYLYSDDSEEESERKMRDMVRKGYIKK